MQVHVQEVDRLGGVGEEEAWGEQGKREQGAEGEGERGQKSVGISVKEVEGRLSSDQHGTKITHLHGVYFHPLQVLGLCLKLINRRNLCIPYVEHIFLDLIHTLSCPNHEGLFEW
jgi:hypothetical protein